MSTQANSTTSTTATTATDKAPATRDRWSIDKVQACLDTPVSDTYTAADKLADLLKHREAIKKAANDLKAKFDPLIKAGNAIDAILTAATSGVK